MRPAEGERHAVLLRQRAIAGVTVDLHDACGAGKMHERLRKSYLDIVVVAIIGATIALVAVIALGSAFGSL
jgi:hypothetical protein